MKLVLDSSEAAYHIESYVAGQQVVVNQQAYTHSLIVTPAHMQAWSPADFDALCAEHFAMLSKWQPDCVLFGSGPRFRFPAAALTAPLINRGIGVEVMDTAAACRTYQVLITEGRQAVAALLI